MKTISSRILILFLVTGMFACDKNPGATNSGTPLEKFFEENVLNKDFVVNFASDNGVDLTANYNGYTFKFRSNSIKTSNFKPNVWNKSVFYLLTPDDLRSKKD